MLGGHVQTILPALLGRRPPVVYRRVRWETPATIPDNAAATPAADFIDLDWVDAPDPQAPLLVLFHGLEGSSNSHYARALMHWTHRRGWMGVVVHFRGCSGEPNRLPRAYHSGDSEEVDWILRRLAAEHPQRDLFAVGVSLGGNALAKWLGEQGEAAWFVRRAAIVSAPLDLVAGGRALGRGFNRVYTQMFLRTLKRKTLDKLRHHPALEQGQQLAAAIERASTLHDFDDAYTAPVHGFTSADDYWTRASSKPWLAHIAVPTLVLNARNDPFLPAEALPTPDEVSVHVKLEQPAEGGHVGFASGRRTEWLDWLPLRVLRWMDGH